MPRNYPKTRKPRREIDADDLRYARLWRGRASMAMIAEALGVPELHLEIALGHPRMALRRGRPWTKVDDAILVAEYATGDTVELARRLGRTPAALKIRTHRLGLRKTAAWWGDWRRVTEESRKYRKSQIEAVRNAVSLPNE